jgi:apolipoprotein N-acyltransferase
MVRAANTGISAIIDADGRIRGSTKAHRMRRLKLSLGH